MKAEKATGNYKMIDKIVILFTLFQIKHFVIDYLWQQPYEWKNKGTYGHLGGIRHALKHGVATAYILVFAPTTHSVPLIFGLVCFDCIMHYHIDWLKLRINARFKMTPSDDKFWVLIGLDHLLHQITMILIIYVAVKGS